MPLSHQLRIFADNWRRKAHAYAVDDLAGAFDRFFTSYVVFNRLYAEATYRLARRGLNLREPFPDSRAAQDYVIQFCGAEMLTRAWEGSADSAAAINQIAEHLINHRFAATCFTGRKDSRSHNSHSCGLQSFSSKAQQKSSTARSTGTIAKSTATRRFNC